MGEYSDHPWRSPQLLYELYVKRDKSTHDIAAELDSYANTISKWLRRHNIDTTQYHSGAEELRDESWLNQRYWIDGESTTDIASELGVDASTVGYWLNKHGLGTRDKNARDARLEDKSAMRNLYIDKDMSGIELTDELDCDRKTVYRWLHQHGLVGEKTPKPHRKGSDNPRFKGGGRDYGESWEPIRRKIRERDGVCQSCGMSRKTHREKWDEDLHVHHIIPAREFDKNDPDMNDPDNLVALCRKCHVDWEGIPVRPEYSD